MTTRFFIAFLFLWYSVKAPASPTGGQDLVKIDSLQNLLKTDINDTSSINIMLILADKFCYYDPDSAIIYAAQAKEIAERIQDSKRIADALIELGWDYYAKGDYAIALQHYFDALEINERIQDQEGITTSLGRIGNVYHEQGEYPTALEYYFKAVKISEKFGTRNGLATLLGNLGNVYSDQGDFPKALDYYFKALRISEELGNKRHSASWFSNIGIVYEEQGHYPEALEYYFKALKMEEEIENIYGIGTKLGNIGSVYHEQGDYPRALEYYFKALGISEELGNKRHIASWLGNIGSVYTDQGDSIFASGDTTLALVDKYPLALEYSFRSLKIDEELGNKRGMAIRLGNIGSLYYNTRNFREAEKHLLKALKIDTAIGYLLHEENTREILSDLYAQTNSYQLAYEHFKAYSSVKDSLFNEDKSKELGRLEAGYEFEVAEGKRVQREEEQAKLLAEQETRRNNLQYSGILIFLVFVFAGVFMSGKYNIPVRLAEGIIFFAFLLFFEFTLVLLDPYIEQYSSGAPAIKLMFNAILAGLIFPLHSFFEEKMKRRLVKAS